MFTYLVLSVIEKESDTPTHGGICLFEKESDAPSHGGICLFEKESDAPTHGGICLFEKESDTPTHGGICLFEKESDTPTHGGICLFEKESDTPTHGLVNDISFVRFECDDGIWLCRSCNLLTLYIEGFTNLPKIPGITKKVGLPTLNSRLEELAEKYILFGLSSC